MNPTNANTVRHCGHEINRYGGLWHCVDKDGEEYGYPGFEYLKDALKCAEKHNKAVPVERAA